MAQPRKPKGSPNGTGGQFDHMNHTDMGLPALDVSNQPVGEEFMDTVNDIASNLSDHQQDWDDLPIGGCYRINDFGDYVTEDDWDEVWDGHPLEEKAWMLADNGRYTSDDVARMTPAEIEAAYDEGDIYTDTYEQHPTYAFYTEKYEDDYDLDEPIGATVADRVRHTGEQLAGQSRESMDFEPGETVHATPDGFVGEHEWEQAWGDQPLYVRAAYELSCRHPGLHMENLSPKQIITMNNSEQAYEQYVWGTGRSNETDTDLDHDTRLNMVMYMENLSPKQIITMNNSEQAYEQYVWGTGRSNETDTDLDHDTRLNMVMYRQNERNAQYAGRDLNNVICMLEAAYTGNDGFLNTQVRQSTLRVLDAPDPTGDMDSLSTIALGLNHDPVHTVEMLTGQKNTKAASEGVVWVWFALMHMPIVVVVAHGLSPFFLLAARVGRPLHGSCVPVCDDGARTHATGHANRPRKGARASWTRTPLRSSSPHTTISPMARPLMTPRCAHWPRLSTTISPPVTRSSYAP